MNGVPGLDIWVRGPEFDRSYTTSYQYGIVTLSYTNHFQVISLRKMSTLKGYSRSLEMPPFDRSHTRPYSSSLVTMWCIYSQFKRITDRQTDRQTDIRTYYATNL